MGKGTLFGIERLEHHIRSVSQNYTRSCYVLKLDILGYFMSISRARLYEIVIEGIQGHAGDALYPYMVDLLGKVIFNDPVKGCRIKGSPSDWDGLPPSKSLFHAAPGCGLPIGNLTSQLFSNIYLNRLDQFVKRTLKVNHYGRYVDDFYLVDSSWEFLLACVEPIRRFLLEDLQLTLHPRKLWLQEQSKGVTFLGCVLKNGERMLTRRAHRLMADRLDEVYTREENPYRVRAVVNSYRGHCCHFVTNRRGA